MRRAAQINELGGTEELSVLDSGLHHLGQHFPFFAIEDSLLVLGQLHRDLQLRIGPVLDVRAGAGPPEVLDSLARPVETEWVGARRGVVILHVFLMVTGLDGRGLTGRWLTADLALGRRVMGLSEWGQQMIG